MKRLSGMLFLCLAMLLLGCQMIVTETDAALQDKSRSVTPTTAMSTLPLSATIALTATVAPTNTSLLTATTSFTESVTAAVDSALGLQLYRQYYCGLCHQSTAAETGGTFGPSHDGMGALAAQRLQAPTYAGAATTAAAYLHESLVDPQRFVVPGYELTPHRMPNYNFLPPQELEQLVTWLLQQ